MDFVSLVKQFILFKCAFKNNFGNLERGHYTASGVMDTASLVKQFILFNFI